MLVSARATIALDGWPPPTIEIHALLAALVDCGHRAEVGPAQAFQHLNEVDISFAFDLAEGARADSRAQQIVLESMARVYGGPIHVHVDVVEAGPTEGRPEVAPVVAPGERRVVDLTSAATAGAGSPGEPACAVSGCGRPAAPYDLTVEAASAADDDLELALLLCPLHARALGHRAVSKAPV